MPSIRRTLIPTTALACILATACSGTASAASTDLRYARFTAVASGTQTTTWKRHTLVSGDCFQRVTTTSSGTEKVRFRAPSRKILAIGSVAAGVQFRTGSWDLTSLEPRSWPATGSLSRDDRTTTTYSPGPCGDKEDPDLAPLTKDCGTRKRTFDVRLGYDPTTRKVGLGLAETGTSDPFLHCFTWSPFGVEDGTFAPIQETYPASEILDSRIGKEIVLAHHTFTTTRPGPDSTRTTVRWELTLVRHR